MTKKNTTKAAGTKRSPDSTEDEYDNTAGVTAIILSMAHPMKPVIESIRETILAADSDISEGVKWNSPSFYCHGWFATVGGRKPDRLEIVLHHGAKIQKAAQLQTTINDPKKLLKWASPDRALITIPSDADFEAIRHPLAAIIQQWAKYQKELFASDASKKSPNKAVNPSGGSGGS